MHILYFDDIDESDTEDSKSEEGNESGFINIDTSVLNDSVEVYSSLTDRNGIALFTTSYEDYVNSVASEEALRQENERLVLFNGEFCSKESAYIDSVKSILFTVDAETVVRQTNTEKKEGNLIAIGIVASIVIVIIGFSVGSFIKKRIGKKDNAADIYTSV